MEWRVRRCSRPAPRGRAEPILERFPHALGRRGTGVSDCDDHGAENRMLVDTAFDCDCVRLSNRDPSLRGGWARGESRLPQPESEMRNRNGIQPKALSRRTSIASLAAVALLAVLLGLAPYIGSRIASARQRSEYSGVVTARSISIRQSKYGARTGHWLEVRLVSGDVIRVQVPEELHQSTTIGSRIEKRAGDPLPKITKPPRGPGI